MSHAVDAARPSVSTSIKTGSPLGSDPSPVETIISSATALADA